MTGHLVFGSMSDGEGETEESSSIGQESEPVNASDKKSTDIEGLYNSVPTPKENDTSANASNTGTTSDSEGTSQEQIHVCPYCDYSSVSEMRLQNHVVSQHTQHCSEILCPLCQEEFKDKSRLEKHLMSTHSVKSEGLQRLLLMVDHNDWIMPPTNLGQAGGVPALPIDESGEINTEALEVEAARLASEAIDTAALPDKMDLDDQYRCQTCSKTFANIDALYAHQNELGHLELKQTPRGPGYLCWKKGCNQYFKTAQALQVHFREIHAKRQTPSASDHQIYKFRCSQCSLAFKTPEKLQLHSQFHLIRAATRCHYCANSFQSIAALRKHVDTGHSELNESDREQYLASINASSVALATILATSGMENIYNSALMSSATTPSSNDIVNSVTSANSVENKTENSKTDLNSNETPDTSSDRQELMDLSENMDTTSPSDNMQNNLSPEPGDTGDSLDLKYKEQQFLEDYINSQAIAEGNYEDPSRKFKCHRCKVAFTKQSYLTAHNKTLLHRKGDKMSYPMEKYLDPNRPFKCDVCKESFTQKNILLVHYNSVSHLHKLKQVSQQGSVPVTTVTTQQQQTQTSVTESNTKNSQANSTATTSTSESDKSKPYKCNICKVAYSQGSTLDIHVRSVAHQTRSSKIQELVMTGEIDLSQPLIEQPNDPQKTQQQHQKILADILQQQPIISVSNTMTQPSLLFPGLPGLPGLPQLSMIPGLSTAVTAGLGLESIIPSSQASNSKSIVQKSENPKTEESDNLNKKEHSIKEEKGIMESELIEQGKLSIPSQALSQMISPTYLCQKCNAVFTNQDSLLQHQLMCFSQSGSSPITTVNISDQSQLKMRNFVGRVKPQVHKNLLENIGFECVMQFNEFSQRVSEKKEKEKETNEEVKEEIKEEKEEEEEEEKVEEDPVDVPMATETDLPEMNKSVCVTCNKEFSSVWVLKAHQEEVHKEVVPTDMVEDFGEKFKCDYEKKQPKDELSNQTDVGNIQSSTSNENGGGQDMPPPPPPQPQMSPQMDLSQMMPMFGLGVPMPIPFSMAVAMNMQPPLMPMMFPLTSEASTIPAPTPPVSNDTNIQNLQKQQLQQAVAMQNQKRARTRINDEQLKVLRAHFDINNSPSEEQILAMAEQSGLPTKVIKHWFRNTLFKERQRNKDSPYNFNNPPSTTLDLEEYEKTGKLAIAEEKELQMEIKKEAEDLLPDDNDDSLYTTSSSHNEINDSYVSNLSATSTTEMKQEQVKEEEVPPPISQSPELSSSPGIYSNMSTPTIPSTPTMSFPLTPVTSHFEDMRMKIDTSPHHHGSYSRRANRTRFTDYQIKVLQEYFEQNAYPKDDELDHLSQLLNLSPRVIVVWFQNARQKARKIYENQPQAEMKEMTASPFQRTPSLNYQCKKCSAVFQRYYDLIRHQKKNCGADSDRHGTSMSSAHDDNGNSDSFSVSSNDESDYQSENGSLTSNDISHSSEKNISDGIKYKCEKCELSFDRFELWQEHQNVHSLNPSLFSNLANNSAFGVLQSMAAAQQQTDKSALYKRKVDDEHSDEQDEQPRDKRLRTTILPEQLDYLYQKYQIDCNPSRKQLESISSDVGLKKRVVQVWFQNTRARERKGQYRAHQQLIHKRCPFCRALFRAKSAMESHLATKHPEEMAKGDINVDNIPDAAIESPGHPSSILSPSAGTPDINKLLSPPGMQSFLPIMPPNSLSLGMNMLGADPLQLSMKQFYEDSLKQYMNDLSSAGHKDTPSREATTPSHSKHHDRHTSGSKSNNDDEAPLDLSKPLKVNTSDNDKTSDGPSTDKSERSYEDHFSISRRRESLDDSISETYSNHDGDYQDSLSISTSRPSSPVNLHSSSSKRYRTQMTSLQVRIMKNIFIDYKTPTMAECEMLGREIGLPKRVVQVWFQNARAKEKKAKLNLAKSFGGPEMDFTKPPEECSLCKFKYSHKYTIQDHIFTRKHLEKIKSFIQSQSDAEREITTSQNALSSSLSSHQAQEIDRMRKVWDEAAAAASVQPHIAQLQAMGLGALGMPPGGIPGLGTPFNPADILREKKSESRKETDDKESEKPKSEKVKKESSGGESSQLGGPLMSLQGFMPGLDHSLLSYMSYAGGMPGYMPGMGMGMPFLQPGFMPGAEQLLAYDPLTFGTPLQYLQIPQQAIKDVSIKLSESKATVAQYTQDCKSISSLRSLVNSVDYSCVREATVDVGYICKKCQMVYPAKDACLTHQRTTCFQGGKVPENIMPWLKLEQIQYECRLCCDKFSTVQEYKMHCQMEAHKVKAARLHHKPSSSSSNSISSSPSKSMSNSSSSGSESAHRSQSSPTKCLSSSSTSHSSTMPKGDDKSSVKSSEVSSEMDNGPENKKAKVE